MSFQDHRRLNQTAFITCMVVLGALTLISAVPRWVTPEPLRFSIFLVVGAIVSVMKVTLPGVKGTLTPGFLVALIGIMELQLPEVLTISSVAALVQCIWHAKKRPAPIQILFNVACICVAVTTTDAIYHSVALRAFGMGPVLLLTAAACAQFIGNTVPIASIIALSEGKPLKKVWRECYFWSFPYYLIGAGLAGGFHMLSQRFGWQAALVTLPVVYVIYRSYRQYLVRLQDEKNHAEQMARLHLRTIEALALAIDAKDATTHDHLRRVQTYAVAIGEELGLDEEQLNALRAAAVLHDIGKLAVPEHIISKPGKLTAEEFEKMKIHPVVGAEILEQVEFPYPVVPIVRAHHEKWDGSGYPFGLRGEQIPIGARILSAVDCLDALASDRQYRPALPLDQAMATISQEANRSFDPRVVEVLQRRYRDLEAVAKDFRVSRPALSRHLKIEPGLEPAAGFEISNPAPAEADFLSSIAAATHEAQALFELTQSLGNSLSLNETLSVFAMRLNHIVPYDAIAIYLTREGRLVPEFVNGDDFRLLSSLRIPIGLGLSGWVAETLKPILNGNPSVEPGYFKRSSPGNGLRSALAVPLQGIGGNIGVLTLYHNAADAFSKDHLRLLLALSGKVGLSIENALKYREAESSATTDFLTGLPNARSLFLRLDAELSRCKRDRGNLTVVVCDLDGFKQVNDRLGHLEGNRVLQLVARGLRESLREFDEVARMGGDEFVILLPGASKDVAWRKSQQLVELVSAVGRQIGDGSDLLGVSVGDASYPEDALDAESLLAVADRRMYKVKEANKQELSQQLLSLGRPDADGVQASTTAPKRVTLLN